MTARLWTVGIRTATVCCLFSVATTVIAQPGATGPIADLNTQARELSETAPEQSLAAAIKAQQAARAAGDIRGEAEAYNYIAYGHRNQSLLDLARTDALESVRLFVQARDRRGEAQGYNTLGLIEADAGRFVDALQNHLKALEIREKDGDQEGLSYTFNNLGNIYRNMGDYQKALEFHQRGLELKVALGNKSSEAYSHHNIGLVYFVMEDYANALAAYRRGLVIREQLKDPRSIAVSLNAIGQVEAVTNPAAALQTYQRALGLRRETGDRRGEMATEINLADVYKRLGRLSDAAAALNRATTIGERLDAPLMKSNALKGLAEVSALRGDYAAAYRHQIEYQAARDKIFNQETSERFHHLEVAQEAERRQQQIQLLEQENALVRTTRTALAAIAALILVTLASLYARYRSKHQSEARLRAKADELSAALDRVQTLRGMLPICAWCKKIREDNGYWTKVESYISSHSAAEFTHCICPACANNLTNTDTRQRA
jgi:tetratricopeptide (TPR) repeat protein